MPATPRLSICVPSRNRQMSFTRTIESLLSSPRQDIEIVLADNSDDPSIMNDYMASRPRDPRVRYLPSDTIVHSMRDNWERAFRITTGDFIAVIGDDDYIDPDVVDLIDAIVARDPGIDVVAWSRLAYNWPEVRTRRSGTFVSLVNEVHRMPKALMVRRMFRWETATHVPSCPFTIYHGAVSRPAMERVRRNFCGRYFEHPIVDYDNSFKLLFSARGLAYIDRPMSVLGVCSKSNSAAIGHYEKALEINQAFIAENGDDYENNDYLRGFPFGTMLGVASAILAAQTWFKRKYGATVDGWEENFARAVAQDCSISASRAGFQAHSELCRRAFQSYEDGRYLEFFKPAWRDTTGQEPFFGLMGRQLLVDETIGATETPAAFYEIIRQVLPELSSLEYKY
jgi:glycosyltransferase involved in cell wall biosynthesis